LYIEDWAVGRLDAYGNIDQSVYPQTGTVNFPDESEREFYYYPDEAVIYWNADKGNTDDTWTGEKSFRQTPRCQGSFLLPSYSYNVVA